jgi:hypothetical protein
VTRLTRDWHPGAVQTFSLVLLLIAASVPLALHRSGELDDDALRVLQEELDLEELRLRRSLAAMRGG